MNEMTDQWTIFGRDQGQIVEVAYRYDVDQDAIIRRTHDRSDGELRYESTTCPEDVEDWCGADLYPPFSPRKMTWTPCVNPWAAEDFPSSWWTCDGCRRVFGASDDYATVDDRAYYCRECAAARGLALDYVS